MNVARLAEKMSDSLNRVFLWCVPRTVSTAVLKCLSFVEDIQVLNEPYNCAFFSGPERKNQNPDLDNPLERRFVEVNDVTINEVEHVRGFDAKVCTYAWVRDQLLEAPYEDKKILFCKDMCYHTASWYHMLPRDFRYSFLIRHPAKVFSSWKKVLLHLYGEALAEYINLQELPECAFPAGYGFKEMYELVEYAEKNLQKEPIILDTDDLLADPHGILSAYCHKMGISYSPDLLSWEAGNAITETWISSKTLAAANKNGGFFNKALQSTGFGSPEPPPALESLPADVQACVEASMGYYEKLRERRITSLCA